MNITLVVGGRWHAFDLARELHLRGSLKRIITNYPAWLVVRWGIPKEKIVSLSATFYLIKIIYKIGGEGLMMKMQWLVHQWFAKKAAEYLDGSELVHAWSSFAEPSLIWAKKRGIPTVLERSSAHILEQSRLLRNEHERLGLHWSSTHPKIEEMELREYALSSIIAVPSSFVEHTFRDRNAWGEKLRRNALGVSLERFFPPESEPEAPQQVGLKVIYAGSLSVQKGIPDLIEGFNKANIANALLTLVGGETNQLKNILNQQQDSVKRVGHVSQEELVHYYHEAHCFVIASIQEGMAMVQMQALACGVPLICSKHSGGEDLLRLQGEPKQLAYGIEEYPAGFVIPVNAPSAIARCLQRFQYEESLWKEKRRAAMALASDELSWSAYGQRAIELYEDLLR